MINRTRWQISLLMTMVFVIFLTGASQAADYVFPNTLAVSLSRTFQDTLVGSADTIVVTVNMSNAESDSLRNLYFSDHVPEEFFDISTTQVQVNGTILDVSEYIHEVGSAAEVFAGTIPHRWVIEAPPDSLGSRVWSNIVDPLSGTMQIVYTARCTTGGDHGYPSYTWAGQLVGGDQTELFGYQDSVFITVVDAPPAVSDLATILSGADLFLFWTPVEHGAGIDHYVVYRDTVAGFVSAGGDSIGVTADTFYVDPSAGGIGDPELSLYYLVRAVDPTGKKSDDSNCAGEFDRTMGNTK